MLLLGVPGDTGDAFFEQGDGIEVSVEECSTEVGEIALVGMLDGDDAVREKAESLDAPAKVVGERNFPAVAEFAEEATFQ